MSTIKSILRFILFYFIHSVGGFAFFMSIGDSHPGLAYLVLLLPFAAFLGAALMQWAYTIRQWNIFQWVLITLATGVLSYILTLIFMFVFN